MLLGAALTLLVADLVAWRLAPPPSLREVEDAIGDLVRGDPTVLVIGSSHGRTFAAMDDTLRARSGGGERMLAVPVEWGKLTTYRWVLEHRLLPLIDETRPGGLPKRPALRRAIIVTEWWDSCHDSLPPRNLPARSWTARDFVDDVADHGITAYNTNYLSYRWQRLWRWSALLQDRGHGRILSAVRQRLAPASDDARRANFDRLANDWRRMVESGADCLGDPREMDALLAMTDTLAARHVEVTVLLYPRMPVTLSPKARETTLPLFAARVRDAVASRGVRVVDLSATSPLTDADFGEDFDHVLPAGNARFSRWALDGPLAFLLAPAE